MADFEIVGHGQQVDLWEDFDSPTIAYVGGMGSGKTMSLVIKAIIWMVHNPGVDILCVGPTYDLVKKVLWPEFRKWLSHFGVKYTLNKGDKTLFVHDTGTLIHFATGENPERIVGFEIGLAIIDEFAMMVKDVYMRCLTRLRRQDTRTGRQVVLGGTPEGAGSWAHKLVLRDDVRTLTTTTLDNPHVPPEYVDEMTAHLSQDEKDAYLAGKWIAFGGSVYHAFNRNEHLRECPNPFRREETGRVELWCDFNVGKMVWLVVVNHQGAWHVWREYVGTNTDTERHANELLDNLIIPSMIEHTGRTPSRGEISAIVDASAHSRSTRASAGRTDETLLRLAGFDVRKPPRNPPILDSVQGVNYALTHGQLYIDPSCTNLIETLEAQGRDKQGMPDKKGGLDHAGDCIRYGIHYHQPIREVIGNRSYQGT